MFREMRRKKQELSKEETVSVLERGSNGVLAVLGDNDYPYAVPVSYAYEDGIIYIHGANTGHKIAAITKHPKVSFCVVGQDNVVSKEFTTYFKSVIAFGRAHVLKEESKVRHALELLAQKYSPKESEEHLNKSIASSSQTLAIIAIEIEHITGKQAVELVK